MPGMAPKMRLLSSDEVFRPSGSVPKARYAGWSGAIPVSRREDDEPTMFGRMGWEATQFLGDGQFRRNGQNAAVRVVDTSRLLTDQQLHLIYQRTPDVRACIDQITRRVSTWPQWVAPTFDPSDAEYEAALEECERVSAFLAEPNDDLETWQELLTKWITDVLKYDRGVIEEVSDKPGGELEELVALRGCDVHSNRERGTGRLLGYVQIPTGGFGVSSSATPIELRTDQVVMLMLFPNTEGTDGLPLLESLVWEVISILRAAENAARSINVSEIPDGLLVVAGIAGKAIQAFKQEFVEQAGHPETIRILGSEVPGQVNAEWVELKRTPAELRLVEIATEIRRAIWRVFGVLPVEMGDTSDMPRATAQVQIDVSQSHLILPLLMLVQWKINSLVLPRILDEKWLGRISFGFDLESKLSTKELLEKAQADVAYVGAGVLTRNEVRDSLGHQPDDSGDVLTVDGVGQPVLLSSVVAEDAGQTVDGNADPNAPADEEPADEEPVDELAAKSRRTQIARRVERLKTALFRPRGSRQAERVRRQAGRLQARVQATLLAWDNRPAPDRAGHHHRGVEDLEEDLPSEWQRPGRFDGVRTLDLPALWEEVAGYSRDVVPLWEQARAAVVEAVRDEYVVDGFDEVRRQRVAIRIADELGRLVAHWTLATSPRYERVALDARAAAGNWTGASSPVQTVRDRAALYRDRSLGYLEQPGGLVADLRQRVLGVLVDVSDVRGRGPSGHVRGLGPGSSAGEVLLAVAGAFDSLRSRIANWAGRLVELASSTLAEEVVHGAGSGIANGIADPIPGDTVEWWCEWSSVGDKRTCATCARLGSSGYMLASTLPTKPGGDTECRARCRCVLVMWTRAEIDGGRAELLGGGNTGKPL